VASALVSALLYREAADGALGKVRNHLATGRK